MGLFDKLSKIITVAEKIGDAVENVGGISGIQSQEDIVLLPASHIVEETEYGDADNKYRITFQINDAFKEAKSHAGEVTMLNTYSPNQQYGEEGKLPYIAILSDDDVYNSVEEFKESGTFDGAIEIISLGGRFYFKAKREYYGDMMYFYGLDRCEGFWENNGLCLVYPRYYVGTDKEAKLMGVLDEVAASYNEEKMG